jgi:hypothetical protein
MSIPITMTLSGCQQAPTWCGLQNWPAVHRDDEVNNAQIAELLAAVLDPGFHLGEPEAILGFVRVRSWRGWRLNGTFSLLSKVEAEELVGREKVESQRGSSFGRLAR